MKLDFKKSKTEALCEDYCHEKNKFRGWEVSNVSVVYEILPRFFKCTCMFCSFVLGIHGWKLPWFYKKSLAIWNKNFKYECVFEMKNPTELNQFLPCHF